MNAPSPSFTRVTLPESSWPTNRSFKVSGIEGVGGRVGVVGSAGAADCGAFLANFFSFFLFFLSSARLLTDKSGISCLKAGSFSGRVISFLGATPPFLKGSGAYSGGWILSLEWPHLAFENQNIILK
jgi:hypothetical protein